jgi:hypothetical protein
MPYKRVKAKGITFVFKYEPDCPDILHIFARHLKEPDDAMHIYLHGDTAWNAQQDLWETRLENEVVWWFWIDQANKVVMIVSCFDE